jgi:hypothetical protein
MLGSAMGPVALAFAILDNLHGSSTDTGIVLACRQVPGMLLLRSAACWVTGCHATW